SSHSVHLTRLVFFCYFLVPHCSLPSFPTRRSSDLGYLEAVRELCTRYGVVLIFDEVKSGATIAAGGAIERYGVHPDLACFAKAIDRKSTRLNSSHEWISYAVFCLKKKITT